MRGSILKLSGFAVLGVAWQALSQISQSPAFPPLNEIAIALLKMSGKRDFAENILASLATVSLGIVIAVVLGFVTALLIFKYERFKTVVMPIVESVRGIAALTLFPLLIVTLGIGQLSRIFVIFWTAWPAVLIATISSLESIEKSIIEAARLDCNNEWDVIMFIRLPLAAYGVLTGVRISVSGGWIGLIAAEMLGATKGLGYFLLWKSQSFCFPEVYATIIVIAGLGGIMNMTVGYLQKKAMI